jgi:hypothetical protein
MSKIVTRQRKPRLKPYDAKPFTNDLKHTINPGDQVLVVTKCTGSVCVQVGRYVGRRDGVGYRSNATNVLVEFDEQHERWQHKETGALVWEWSVSDPTVKFPSWPTYPRHPGWSASQEQLKQHQDASAIIQKKYEDDQKAARAANKAYLEANYTKVVEKYVRRSTLQLNRIYPVNMSLSELDGKRLS